MYCNLLKNINSAFLLKNCNNLSKRVNQQLLAISQKVFLEHIPCCTASNIIFWAATLKVMYKDISYQFLDVYKVLIEFREISVNSKKYKLFYYIK